MNNVQKVHDGSDIESADKQIQIGNALLLVMYEKSLTNCRYIINATPETVEFLLRADEVMGALKVRLSPGMVEKIALADASAIFTAMINYDQKGITIDEHAP